MATETAFVSICLLSLTQLRGFTLQIVHFFLCRYTLLRCSYSPPPALLPTRARAHTQPLTQTRSHSLLSLLPLLHTHASTLPPLSHTQTHILIFLPLPPHQTHSHTTSPHSLLPCPSSLPRFVTHSYTIVHSHPSPNTFLICPSTLLSHIVILSPITPSPFSAPAPLLPLRHTVTATLPHCHIPCPLPPPPVCTVFSFSAWSHTHTVTLLHTHTPLGNTRSHSRPSRYSSPAPPWRPAAAPMTSRRARGAARRGRRLAGRASAALQSRRGSYNCGGMGGTDHCIAHL